MCLKLPSLFGRSSRQAAKLKTLFGLTVSRLAVLRNQRLARCSHARKDVAQLLCLGQQDRALLRAEQVIKEQNMLDAFVLIESYCHLLIERAALFERLRECPDELREAVSGLIFAAARCGDLPELLKVRYIFSSKFGRELTAAAVELRNNCGVNSKLIQKLSTRQPSLESKIKVAKEIAAEQGITLDLEDTPSTEVQIYQEDSSLSEKQSQPPRSPPVNLAGLDLKDGFSFEGGEQQYGDVVTAAQAAFESAAYAAAAARVAVELSRAESQGKGPDDHNSPSGGSRTGAEDWREGSIVGSNIKKIHAGQKFYSPESEEELVEEQGNRIQSDKPTHVKLEKSSSVSSSNSVEIHLYVRKSSITTNSIGLGSGKMDLRKIAADESEDEKQQEHKGATLQMDSRVLGYDARSRPGFTPTQFDAAQDEGFHVKHRPTYLHPSYSMTNPTRFRDDPSTALYDEKDGTGLGPRSGDDYTTDNCYEKSQAERIYPDPAEKLHAQGSTVGQRPVSMRTRRGLQP